MPEVVSGAVVYAAVFLLLTIGAVAVGVSERRRRVAVRAAGGSWPVTGGYRAPAVGPLVRVEAARIARHPVLWLGILAAGLTVGLSIAGRGFFGDPHPSDLLVPIIAPLLLGLFAAIHLGVGRDGHAGMDELSATLPTSPRARTVGHLLAATVVAVPLGLAAVTNLLVRLGPDRTFAGWTAGPFEIPQPGLVVVVVAALAVAAGRWWPHPAAGFLVPLLLFFTPMLWGVALYQLGGPHTAWGTDEYVGTIGAFHLTGHLVFLAGYLTLAVAAALGRHDRRPPVLIAGALGIVALVGGYLVKVPSWHWLA